MQRVMLGRARLGCFVLVLACADDGPGPEDNPESLRDSTGAVFGWPCDAGGCVIEVTEGTPELSVCAPDYDTAYGWFSGRFFEICATCIVPNAFQGTAGRCRPAACEANSDCPQLYWVSHVREFECRSGLCQSRDDATFPPDEINTLELTLLCFANVSREDTEEDNDLVAQIDEIVAANCPDDWDEPCSVPPECWQP